MEKDVHRYVIIVPAGAVDENGHANNVSYIQWMQDAAVQHSGKAGCTGMTRDDGATWVVRSHRIEYFLPALMGERLTVLTWVSNFRKVRSLRKYRFLRDRDEVLLAAGETDWVYVDAKSGRPKVVPEAVRAAFTVVSPEIEP